MALRPRKVLIALPVPLEYWCRTSIRRWPSDPTAPRAMKYLFKTLFTAALFAPSAVGAQQARAIDIGIMVDVPPAELTSLFDQMRAEIVAVVGAAATIRMTEADIQANGFDPARAGQIYEDMVADDTDLIIAFGPVSAAAVAGRNGYPKPTVVFGGVNRDLLDLPAPGSSSGISNFTYVISAESYVRDLRTLQDLYAFERVGIAIPPGPIEALQLEERLREIVDGLGVDFELISFEGPESVAVALDRIDAFYLLESLFIPDEEIAEVSDMLIARGIPSFSGSRRDDVELGLMATNQPREGLDAFFRRLALLVESVANGEDLADLPVFFDLNQTLTLNFHTARAIGVPIRYSLISTTEFVGEYENPLAEQTYSLVDLIDEALAANLALESGRRDVRLAEQDARSSWSSYLPSVTGNVTQSVIDTDLAAVSNGQNPQFSTQGGVSVTQAIFSPDANAGISIQRSLVGAQREALRASEWDIVVDAASVYFTALILKANLEIQSRNLDATKRNLRIAEQSFGAGQTGRGDVLRLQSESAQDMQSLVEAVNALEQSYHAINQLANRPIDREIDVLDMTMRDGAFSDEDFELIRGILDDPSLREPFEDWLALEAITNSPELRIFDYNIDAVGRTVRLNGAERYLPTVAAGLDLNRTFTQRGVGAPAPGMGLSQYYTLGVSASIPLFDSNRRHLSRQTAQIQQDQLRLNRSDASIQVERAVRDIVLDLTNEIANLQLSAISEEAASESLELAQAAYASGAVTVVELLDAQTNYLSAQLARASAIYNFLATSVGLQRLVGHFSLLSAPELNDAYMLRFQEFLQSRGGQP